MNVKTIHSRVLRNINLLSSIIEVLARVREAISVERPADIYDMTDSVESDSESTECESVVRTLTKKDLIAKKPSARKKTPRRTIASAVGPANVQVRLQSMFGPHSLSSTSRSEEDVVAAGASGISGVSGPSKKAPPRRVEEKKQSILRRVSSRRNYYIEQVREETMRKEISFEEYLMFCNSMYTTIVRYHQQLIDTYYLSTVNVVLKCMVRTNDEQALVDEYGRIVSRGNIFNIINYLVRELQYLTYYIEDNTASSIIMSDISDIKFKTLSIRNDLTIIDNTIKFGECCGAPMVALNDTSELVCGNCNKIKKIDGILLRDCGEYRAKHGSYDSMRHYKFWIDHIQGKDLQTFEGSFLAKLKLHLLRMQPNEKLFTYEQVRDALKHTSIRATKINNYVSLLLRLMGGPPCPILNYEENSLASFRFSRIMCLFVKLKEERIIDADGKKKPYYPYFIYKILEHMLWTSPKLRILNYIYLQSRKTIIKNDCIYKSICAAADPSDGLVYKPTNHTANMAQIDRNLKSYN